MTKKIKFNLICDGNSVRNIEDLQKNFSIEDVLRLYKKGLLHEWLERRGYMDELNKVNSITAIDDAEIIKELIHIFSVSKDDKKVDEVLGILSYKSELEKVYLDNKNNKSHTAEIMRKYQDGYYKLIADIIYNKDNVSKIKAAISTIISDYLWVFALDHRNLFYHFLKNAPAAIFVMLTFEEMRKFFLPEKLKNNNESSLDQNKINLGIDGAGQFINLFNVIHQSAVMRSSNIGYGEKNFTYDTEKEEFFDKREMYDQICKLLEEQKLKEILGENLKVYDKYTESTWQDIEVEGKYMILMMPSNSYIRPYRDAGKEGFEPNEVNKKFLIIDGIYYKNTTTGTQLYYMEV